MEPAGNAAAWCMRNFTPAAMEAGIMVETRIVVKIVVAVMKIAVMKVAIAIAMISIVKVTIVETGTDVDPYAERVEARPVAWLVIWSIHRPATRVVWPVARRPAIGRANVRGPVGRSGPGSRRRQRNVHAPREELAPTCGNPHRGVVPNVLGERAETGSGGLDVDCGG